MEGYRRTGTTFKVNMALKGPRFRCLPEDRGQFGSTIHLLPDEGEVMASLTRSFADVAAGRLPGFDHRVVHPHHGGPLDARRNRAPQLRALRAVGTAHPWRERPGRRRRSATSGTSCRSVTLRAETSDLVVDTFSLHPRKIESHFITGGHIHHVDNTFGFSDRLPYAQPVDGLYSASAGCHPAGSVIRAAGTAPRVACCGPGPGLTM